MITNEQLEFDRLLQEHPSEEAWESYALGQVDETQLERMDMHLFVCDSCQATLEDADRFVKALRASSLAQVAPASESIFDKLQRTIATLRWTQYPLVAGACAVLALALWFGLPTQQGPTLAVVFPPSVRALEASIQTRAGHPLTLTIPAPVAGPFTAEVVTDGGSTVWKGQADIHDGFAVAQVAKALRKGSYWVRLYSGARLISEHGLEAQ